MEEGAGHRHPIPAPSPGESCPASCQVLPLFLSKARGQGLALLPSRDLDLALVIPSWRIPA